ncbi:MAG: nuclear transport factor 2 family protein, partial [Candidatus Nanopelagicales bacterium]|nr:nuclear transport factor 2 family protein [Candidatus Nanopelagicales bacterium]
MSLEQRLQIVEDRFAISDLLVRYAVLLDDRRFDEVGMLFTDDGVFSSPNSRTVGRAAIIE